MAFSYYSISGIKIFIITVICIISSNIKLEKISTGLTDGKRPDGMSLAPWSSGKLLVWDATCSDTFAPSHRSQATHAPGEVAARAEERKEAKYISLPAGHQFVPVAVETMGAMGPRTLLFLKELGKRMRAQTGEARSADYLLQRLSAAVQRGNAISIMSGLLEGARDSIT